MSEPTTPTGKRIMAGYGHWPVSAEWRADIVAIEQEAARAERERIAAGVRGMAYGSVWEYRKEPWDVVARAAVLAIIEGSSDE